MNSSAQLAAIRVLSDLMRGLSIGAGRDKNLAGQLGC
jgi:hypothetical protein